MKLEEGVLHSLSLLRVSSQTTSSWTPVKGWENGPTQDFSSFRPTIKPTLRSVRDQAALGPLGSSAHLRGVEVAGLPNGLTAGEHRGGWGDWGRGKLEASEKCLSRRRGFNI